MPPRRKQDQYGRRAKREGFPARSVYKLEEIDRRSRLLKKGHRVLDLGASPGSWSLYAANRVGPTGRVIGIDIQAPDVALPAHAEIRVLDAFAVDPSELGGPFDVVLSDMAPKTSGQRHADQYRSFELYMRALNVATQVLVPGGSFVGKIFQGQEFDEARKATREAFTQTRILRPNATRHESYELFLLGKGHSAPQNHQ
ncbi:MAG: RlmE family RNA methyltransferase [Myxococcota bacterium]